MSSQGTSNSKLPGQTTHTINFNTEIFPGKDGKENTANFILVFSKINQLIKQHDLGPHLADKSNTKIKKQSDRTVALNQTRDNLVTSFCGTYHKKEKEKFRIKFIENWKSLCLDIYLAQEDLIPLMVIAGLEKSGETQA